MGNRALRHFYDDENVRLDVDESLGSVIDPWTRHRARLLEELASLTDEQWLAASRCDGWSNRDVVCHLLDVDSFWTLSLEAGRVGTPTSYLATFDPKASPLDLVEARSAMSVADVYGQFAKNTAALRTTVESFDEKDWRSRSESPIGHVSSRLTLAHALWDSWLHEWDVLVPLGLAPEPESDELFVVAWYTIFFGATQGGLIGDARPVGPGATDTIDAQLKFDEFPVTVRVVIDTDVRLEAGNGATAAGPAIEFVEALTGRAAPFPPQGFALPTALHDHFERARQIL
jgi:uncharacterized protein (TIGR03083 family)